MLHFLGLPRLCEVIGITPELISEYIHSCYWSRTHGTLPYEDQNSHNQSDTFHSLKNKSNQCSIDASIYEDINITSLVSPPNPLHPSNIYPSAALNRSSHENKLNYSQRLDVMVRRTEDRQRRWQRYKKRRKAFKTMHSPFKFSSLH